MNIWQAIGLGIVQALTEFLPVSSSGHLALTQQWLAIEGTQGATFEVAVHLGTLLSVLCFFYQDLKQIIMTMRQQASQSTSLAWFIIFSSIPAGIIGVAFKDQIEALFQHTQTISIALCVTGCILIATLWLHGTRDHLKVSDAWWIGIAQAFAIIPGISRSGSTITMALVLGISRTQAARLSFLMSIPVVAGAGLLKAIDCVQNPPSADMLVNLLVGGVTAFLVGLWALSLMLKWIQSKYFAWFGAYCLLMGLGHLVMP